MPVDDVLLPETIRSKRAMGDPGAGPFCFASVPDEPNVHSRVRKCVDRVDLVFGRLGSTGGRIYNLSNQRHHFVKVIWGGQVADIGEDVQVEVHGSAHRWCQ